MSSSLLFERRVLFHFILPESHVGLNVNCSGLKKKMVFFPMSSPFHSVMLRLHYKSTLIELCAGGNVFSVVRCVFSNTYQIFRATFVSVIAMEYAVGN